MAETILITTSDIKDYENISDRWTAKTERFESYAMEVQRRNLRQLLKPDLYYAFMDDLTGGVPQTDIYTDLLNGVEYVYNDDTIQYYGLKPFLVYHWLAVAVRRGDLHMSIYGGINMTNNPAQEFERPQNKEYYAKQYLEVAQDYANDIVQFLNEKSENYPIWQGHRKEYKTGYNFDII